MRFIVSLLGVSLFFVSKSVFASYGSYFYFDYPASINVATTVKLKIGTPDGDNPDILNEVNLDLAFGDFEYWANSSFVLGYMMNSLWGIEFEFGNYDMLFDRIDGEVYTDSDILNTMIALEYQIINFRFNVLSKESFNLYLKAGAGFGSVQLKAQSLTSGGNEVSSMFQGVAGVSYEVIPALEIFTSFHYLMNIARYVELVNYAGKTRARIHQSSVQVGFRIKLFTN